MMDQRGLASIVYKCFDKKTFSSGIENENTSNKDLAEELHQAITRKCSNLMEELISKCNRGIRFLLCVIDIISKYI